MTKKLLFFIIAVILCYMPMLKAGAVNPDLELSIKPIKDVYALGEPLSCEFLLKNISKDMLRLNLDYPYRMGLAFKENGAGKDFEFPRPGGWSSLKEMPPGDEYKAVIALNRYIALSPGSHNILFQGRFPHYPLESRERRVLHVEGELKIQITDKKVDSATIIALCDGLDAKEPKKLKEAIELLLWVDDQSVIPALCKAARLIKTKSADIVNSLAKFTDTEKGQEAFYNTASAGYDDAVQAAYKVCSAKKITPPDSFLSKNLASADVSKRYHTLDYLMKHGTKHNIEQVGSVLNDPTESIRKLAEKVLKKLSE